MSASPTARAQRLRAGIERVSGWRKDLLELQTAAWELKQFGSAAVTSTAIAKAKAHLAFISESAPVAEAIGKAIEAGLAAAPRSLIEDAIDYIIGVCKAARDINKDHVRAAAIICVVSDRPSKVGLISATAKLIRSAWLPDCDAITSRIAEEENSLKLALRALRALPNLQRMAKDRLDAERLLEARRQPPKDHAALAAGAAEAVASVARQFHEKKVTDEGAAPGRSSFPDQGTYEIQLRVLIGDLIDSLSAEQLENHCKQLRDGELSAEAIARLKLDLTNAITPAGAVLGAGDSSTAPRASTTSADATEEPGTSTVDSAERRNA